MFALLTLPRGPAPTEPEPSGAVEPVGIVIRPARTRYASPSPD